jgi:ABC-type sugar transport system ATPase subunit
MSALLSMRGIRKRFGGVQALNGVALEVRAGEVHALVGENGAGKSTLMHILAGVHQPDEGRIDFAGNENVVLANEHAAQQCGIAIVFQERSLFSSLNVAENIFAGRQPVSGWGRIKRKELYDQTRVLLREVGLTCDAAMRLSDLSAAEQQMVEIAKALSLKAKLIIFDEPTAALTDTETTALFRVIADLKRRGVAVIYISHRLEEIFKIAERVTVLKDGAGQGTFEVAVITPDGLITLMVGRALSFHRAETVDMRESPVMLEVRNLSDSSLETEVKTVLREISFNVRRGEIVALAGLCGAGRTELALSIFGARPRHSGEVLVGGQRVEIRSPADAIAAGLAYVPEDRKEAGLFLDMTIAQNTAAGGLKEFGAWWFNDAKSHVQAEEFRKKLRITSYGVKQVVQSLSGGNQQKVVLAKWLLIRPKVLIVDEPTRGIDVGAKSEVHNLIRDRARTGTAILVISSDLPEVLALADHIVVMREGRIAGELTRAEASEEKIMQYASMKTAA